MNNSEAILQAIQQLERKLGKELKEQRQLIMALQRDSGGIAERQLQDTISRQFGGRYSKQLLARSIVDFFHMFTAEVFDRRVNKAAGALAFIRPATQVGHIKHDLCKPVLTAFPPQYYCRPGGPCQA